MLHIARELVVTRRRAQHFFHLGLFFFLLLSLFHSTRRDSIIVWEIEKGPHTIFIWFFLSSFFFIVCAKIFLLRRRPVWLLPYCRLKELFCAVAFPFQLWNVLLYFFMCRSAYSTGNIPHYNWIYSCCVIPFIYFFCRLMCTML